MILKTVEKTVIEQIPVAFMCDICEKVIELTSDFDIKYHNKVSDHMAVVKYSTPMPYGGADAQHELHCCSTRCLASAIKRIPFNATITIPMGEKFIKQAFSLANMARKRMEKGRLSAPVACRWWLAG